MQCLLIRHAPQMTEEAIHLLVNARAFFVGAGLEAENYTSLRNDQ